jgi:hypothetical protein
VLLVQDRVPLDGIESFLVPLRQIGGLEDRNVHVAVVEDVLHEVVLGVLLVLL